jgi:hypothetical protein
MPQPSGNVDLAAFPGVAPRAEPAADRSEREQAFDAEDSE